MQHRPPCGVLVYLFHHRHVFLGVLVQGKGIVHDVRVISQEQRVVDSKHAVLLIRKVKLQCDVAAGLIFPMVAAGRSLVPFLLKNLERPLPVQRGPDHGREHGAPRNGTLQDRAFAEADGTDRFVGESGLVLDGGRNVLDMVKGVGVHRPSRGPAGRVDFFGMVQKK